MSPSQYEPPREQSPASGLIPPGAERERGPAPYPESPPLMSLGAAALLSFVFLNVAFWRMFPLLSEFLTDEGGLGPLLLPTVSDSLLVEALVGTAVLTIISLTILLVERHLKFSGWIPFVASFPVTWALTLPSALEHGGSLKLWLAFGAMIAGIFCLHWGAFSWARSIWD
jgi:hypothetical protein